MAVTDYITVGGMILGEVTNGVMRNYGTDALGSVVATFTGGALENTYRYKPYGGLLAKTGAASDPSFLWNGGSGYRASSVAPDEIYIQGRHYSSQSARWSGIDPSWPAQLPYSYCYCAPTTYVDPDGSSPPTNAPPPISISGSSWPEAWVKTKSRNKYYGVSATVVLPACCTTNDKAMANFVDFYLSFARGHDTLIDCGASLACPRGWAKVSKPSSIFLPNSLPCPECGPLAPISITLTWVGSFWSCQVGSGSPQLVLPLSAADGGQQRVQMAVGAGWSNGRMPAESQIAWSPALVQTSYGGPWSPWTAQDAEFNPKYDNPNNYYSVTSTFPIVASLNSTSVPCGTCPSGGSIQSPISPGLG